MPHLFCFCTTIKAKPNHVQTRQLINMASMAQTLYIRLSRSSHIKRIDIIVENARYTHIPGNICPINF